MGSDSAPAKARTTPWRLPKINPGCTSPNLALVRISGKYLPRLLEHETTTSQKRQASQPTFDNQTLPKALQICRRIDNHLLAKEMGQLGPTFLDHQVRLGGEPHLAALTLASSRSAT
jgi:hypothetical protein